MLQSIQRRIDAVRQCAYLPWKAGLAIVSAIVSAGMLRGVCSVAYALLPSESWAAEVVQLVLELTAVHFTLAMGVASLGGAVSLFRELRVNMQGFTLTNALGHMITAQFAGLLAYFIAVDLTWSVTVGLGFCGAAGWGGNEFIAWANGFFVRRAGVDLDRRSPPQ